ncbi:DUF6188 family protein [Paenibacillus sp. KN14-4R]|uniref:DUF6188 family protein n=1 Tax=Paenibacillus sp. KN14-4R TaxID=3445773 RepID=UPI003F9FDFF9
MNRPKSDINFSSFKGQRINEINRMYPILIFDIGHLTIECPWRLRNENRILVGEPETKIENRKKQAYLDFEKHILNNSIVEIIHYEDISDLVIIFENDVILELFHDSSWYEGWQLQGSGNFLVVSTPGGQYSYWKE